MIKGFCINITDKIRTEQANIFAQWIGASNVLRNQKINEFNGLLAAGTPNLMGQSYAPIKKAEGLDFLLKIPVQILRNTASLAYADAEAARKGIRKFPKTKGRNKKRSATLTKELFKLEPLESGNALLTVFESAKKNRQKIFSVQIQQSVDSLSNQFRISRLGNKFWISGSYNDGKANVDNAQLLSEFGYLTEAELHGKVTGIDRGVVRPIQSSDGLIAAYNPCEVAKLKKLHGRKAKYQRILARKKRLNKNVNTRRCETNNQRVLASKISSCDSKIGAIRKDFAHQASRKLVDSSNPIIALEALNLVGMTKKARPKKGVNGRGYQRNRARAKSGLNRSMLNVGLGRLGDYITYKANADGKAVIEVSPYNTSRECNECGSLNTSRPNQADFICHNCNHKDNADNNAAKVIAKRAVIKIANGTFAAKAKPKKITARRKSKVVYELASLKKSGKPESAEMLPIAELLAIGQ
jgi:putative transposase